MNLKDTEDSRDYYQREMNKNWELFTKACGENLVLQKRVEELQKALEYIAEEDNAFENLTLYAQKSLGRSEQK